SWSPTIARSSVESCAARARAGPSEATGEAAEGDGMPFVKTEVDIKTDYTVETVDPDWLKQGVKSPKHLMLDPEPCILCRACEDVCPWNCIFMLDPGIVRASQDEAIEAEVESAFAIFVVDDNACTRCSVCV